MWHDKKENKIFNALLENKTLDIDREVRVHIFNVLMQAYSITNVCLHSNW